MTIDALPSLNFTLADGRALGLRINRFDERQRRLRLWLPKTATCWDYAPLIDVVQREPGFSADRYTGTTAADWLDILRTRGSADQARFAAWYESVIGLVLDQLARRTRMPNGHYCMELAAPPFVSSLADSVRDLRLRRASVEQWLGTLRALTGRGIKSEELDESGVLTRLERLPPGTMLRTGDVRRLIDLFHIVPKFSSEFRHGFEATRHWCETCTTIPPREFRQRGLVGSQASGSRYVIRYRHRSLGWSIIRCWHRDLFTWRSDWWGVLDEKGRSVLKRSEGFVSAQDAIAWAESRIRMRFAAWGRDQALNKFEVFSLPGGKRYHEVLLQLDDWPGDYQSPHYRTRNVLAHIRTSLRETAYGRKVLFLDEVQSDWHGDLRASARQASTAKVQMPPDAPFRRDWPLLCMKLMLWWAQRMGAEGLAWSTAVLQSARWRGHKLPETLYQSELPDAARALAKTLGIAHEQTIMWVRTSARNVRLGERGWLVCNRQGVPITKPFALREQAERLADDTGQYREIEVPVLWLDAIPTIRAIPIYGVASADQWFQASGSAGGASGMGARRRLSDCLLGS